MIYADNAATTKMDPKALSLMKRLLDEEYANPSQPYSFSRNAKKILKTSRETIAQCINAEPDEIIFTSGGTESDNWALKGTAMYDNSMRCIITSEIEHHAVLNSCYSLERLGYPVVYLKSTDNGIISPEALKEIIHSPVLVSVMTINNEIGTIQPISELAEIAHAYGAAFHTDAVQAVGHIVIDVKSMNIDMLSASAHKFNGPKGIGFLYIRKGINCISLHNGGAQEFGVRAGTENVPAIAAMAEALKNNVEHMKENQAHISKVSKTFLNSLEIDYKLNGAGANRSDSINSISICGRSGESMLHILDLKGICVSTGAACDSVNTQISHVLNAINLTEDMAKGTIRVSFGKYNTIEEAVEIANEINRFSASVQR